MCDLLAEYLIPQNHTKNGKPGICGLTQRD